MIKVKRNLILFILILVLSLTMNFSFAKSVLNESGINFNIDNKHDILAEKIFQEYDARVISILSNETSINKIENATNILNEAKKQTKNVAIIYFSTKDNYINVFASGKMSNEISGINYSEFIKKIDLNIVDDKSINNMIDKFYSFIYKELKYLNDIKSTDRVFDLTSTLPKEDINIINKRIAISEDKYNISIFTTIIKDDNGKNYKYFLKKIYNEKIDSKNNAAGILIDLQNNKIFIDIYGDFITENDKKTIKEILDEGLKNNSISYSILSFIKNIEKYNKVKDKIVKPKYKNRVFDYASLLSKENIKNINIKIGEIEEKHKINIIISTIDNIKEKSHEAFIDDLYGEKIGDDIDGTGLLIDMNKRRIHINTAGKAISVIDDARINNLLDNIVDSGLKDGDIYSSVKSYLKGVDNYFELGAKEDNIIVERKQKVIFKLEYLFYSIITGGIISLLYYMTIRKKYKFSGRQGGTVMNSFIDLNLSINQSKFIGSYVRTRRISKETSKSRSSSGSSSTTHTSSSGGSYGGGGRSF